MEKSDVSGGLRWSPEELAAYEAKRFKRLDDGAEIPEDTPDPGPERTLQAKCEAWCKERGWVTVHIREARGNRKGVLDLIVFCPEGRVKICEFKAKGGRLSPEQVLEIRMLQHLGHEVHVVKSFRAFVRAMLESAD